MISDLRALDRNWRESGTVEDEVRLLRALVVANQLHESRVGLAAGLGHAAAKATGVLPPEMPGMYREKVKTALAFLSPRECVSFSLDCASRVISKWEALRPSDARPRQAIEATQRWLDGRVDGGAAEKAGVAALDAVDESDDPSSDPSPELRAAFFAADSASHAAVAAADADAIATGKQRDAEEASRSAAYCAEFAVSACEEQEQERHWQTQRLIEYLLKRVPSY